MALIKCPECGRQVSSLAKSCPSCAYPIPQAPMVITPSDAPKRRPGERSKLTGETIMRFRNPVTGDIVELAHPFLWTLLFGPLYWAKHEAWLGAMLGGLAAVLTFGLSWLIAPVFAQLVLRHRYLRNGWDEA